MAPVIRPRQVNALAHVRLRRRRCESNVARAEHFDAAFPTHADELDG